MIYTYNVLEICENGDALVELPDELIKELNWEIGDTLDYELKNEAVFIKNLSKEKRDASAT